MITAVAVSQRSILGPSDTDLNPKDLKASLSNSFPPASGPIAIKAGESLLLTLRQAC